MAYTQISYMSIVNKEKNIKINCTQSIDNEVRKMYYVEHKDCTQSNREQLK